MAGVRIVGVRVRYRQADGEFVETGLDRLMVSEVVDKPPRTNAPHARGTRQINRTEPTTIQPDTP